ncbi:MAG: hypothetical protein GQ574_22990 [Crocinitomix sp.]|nr:hypothetical protein [Crocinitomix sp.]
MKGIFLLLIILTVPFVGLPQNSTLVKSCKGYFETGSKFKYSDSQYDAVVRVKKGFFIEKSHNSDFYVKSRIEWVSDCSFKLTIIKLKGDIGVLRIGDYLLLTVLSVNKDGSELKYRTESKNGSHELSLIKLR